jgi:glycolate oxidase
MTLPIPPKPSEDQLNQATNALMEALPDVTSTSPEDLLSHSHDGLKIPFPPSAVVRPSGRDQIGTLLKLANQYGIPVTTRGTASTLTGSATPVHGGWVLDVSGLNEFTIDPLTNFCHAQTGAIVGKIQEAALQKGRMYPPDPSSLKWCTIGGNIACNAGGLRCVKYGVTRDYVVSLEGFLPTGEFVKLGRDLKKFASGYNLRDLWIGSEGMLGVITNATLRLIPAPKATRTFLAAYSSERKAIEAVLALLEAGYVQPSILEFLDRLSVKGAEKTIGQTLFPESPGSPLLLVEIDGHPAQVQEDAEIVRAWLKRTSVNHIKANNVEEAENLWQVRRKCSSAMFMLANTKLNQDVVVPLRKQADLVEYVDLVRKNTDLPIAVFGHAGDGNLHVNVMYDRTTLETRTVAAKAVRQIMEKVTELGGSISGEHGIGLAKTPFTDLEFSPAELQAMANIKKTLDPNNILNPGKLFHLFEPWKHTPREVHLPWDHTRNVM